jgi:hypothetical protein
VDSIGRFGGCVLRDEGSFFLTPSQGVPPPRPAGGGDTDRRREEVAVDCSCHLQKRCALLVSRNRVGLTFTTASDLRSSPCPYRRLTPQETSVILGRG